MAFHLLSRTGVAKWTEKMHCRLAILLLAIRMEIVIVKHRIKNYWKGGL